MKTNNQKCYICEYKYYKLLKVSILEGGSKKLCHLCYYKLMKFQRVY